VFSIDETGVATVPNESSKIIGLKGKKVFGILSSADRIIATTMIICCDAAGQYAAPFYWYFQEQDKICIS
jgi:hypothetical protein